MELQLKIHGTPTENPWNSMALRGTPWNYMAFHGTPWILHGNPWNSMEFQGTS